MAMEIWSGPGFGGYNRPWLTNTYIISDNIP